MTTVDSLDIQISASAQKANAAINSLSRNLDTLAKKLKFDTSSLEKLNNLNGDNFKRLGEGIKDLSAGMKELKNVRTSDFNALAKGIEKLSAIPTGNLQTVANALTPLADGIRTLSSVNFDNRNLQNLINSLTRLSNANVGSLSSVDFTGIGNKIKELATALSGADKVEQNTISMVNAIAKLAGAGANISTVTAELPNLGTALKDFMNTMSRAPIIASETIAFTQAIGQLASAGSKAETVANSLQHLGDELKRFMQTMATAPSVSAGVIRMTEALARLANAGGGSGRAASSLGNALNGLNISAIRLMPNMSRLSVSIKGIGAQMSKTVNNVKSLGRQLLGAMGIVGGIYGAVRGIKKSIDISSDLTEVQNVVDVTFKDMAYKVEKFAETSIEEFGLSELSLKQYASRFQAMGSAMGINSSLISDANSRLSEMTNGYISASDSMSDVSLNLTKLTADMASFHNVAQKDVADDLAAIFTGQTRPLRDYGLDLTQATLQEWALKQGLDADMKSMSQAEKTMLRYQYVMANTGAAHNDFSRTAKTWANQTRILKQNFEQLASVMGRTFISALKPLVEALNAAMSHIIAFAETVSNALGKIFGWKFEKGSAAGGLTGLVGDAGALEEGLGGAEEAAKKLNKQLRAFDELKVINTDDGGGAGGAGAGGIGAGGAAGQGGQWVQTDSILQDYESSLDTLYKLGDYIGTKLSEAMERIDWNGVYEKARNFGSGLANFLNGLISPQLFSNIGTTVAGALNTALHFLDSFGETFDFTNFGNSLSDGLTSFLNGIQWETALSAASNWGKGIGDALNSFITPGTFGLVGSSVANALNVAVQFALDLGTTLDFNQFGESIATSVNNFFATFDFDKLADTLNVWAKGVLDAMIAALEDTDWYEIGRKIGDFISEIDFVEISGKVANVVWEAIGAALETWTGSFREAPLETTLITAFALFKWTKLGSFVSVKIGQAIASALGIEVANAGIGTVLIAALKTAFSTALAGAGGLSGLFTLDVTALVAEGGLATAGLTIGTAIGGGVAAAIAGWNLGQWINEAITGEEIDMSWAEQFDEIFKSFTDGSWKDALRLWGNDIRDAFIELANWRSEVIEKWKEAGKNLINGLLDGITGKISTIGNWVKEHIFDPFITGFKNAFGIHSPSTVMMEMGAYIIQGLLDGITSLVGSITETWESMKSTAIEVWETVSSSLSEKWATTKETAITTWGEIKENLNTTWDNMKATAETNFGAIKDYIAEKWADSESSTDSTWGRIQETVSSIASDVSGVVSDKFAEITGSFSGFSTNAQSLWSSTWDNIQSTLNSILGSIKDAVGSAFDWISSKINSIQSAANGVVSGSLGGVVSGAINGRTYTATAQIPMFAKGGVFRGGNPFMAIVNDQPRGQTNVETPLKVIREALREELASFTDNFDTLQLTPTFEVGQFQPMPPLEFSREYQWRGVYETAQAHQREQERAMMKSYGNVYGNDDDGYSEEIYILRSQNELLRRQNELLEQIARKEFGISKSDIGKAARDYSIEYFNRTGNPAYQF